MLKMLIVKFMPHSFRFEIRKPYTYRFVEKRME